jgi:DNA polymerase-1
MSATESLKRTADRICELIDTPEKFEKFVSQLRKQKAFCLDLETTGAEPTRSETVGWAFSWEPGCGWYLPVQAPPGQPRLDGDMVLRALRPILEDPNVQVANQNIKHDMIVLRRAGVRLEGIGVDPMVGDYLLDAGARTHDLSSLAARYLNHRMILASEVVGTGKTQKKMFEVDVDRAAARAAEDADVAWQLAVRIGERLKAEGLWDLYWDLERPLIPVLAEMEFNGVRVDVDELRRQSEDVSRRLDTLMAEIHELAGREFNIGSPKQLAEVLFDGLKLRVVKRTKTGPSTDQEVLEILAGEHALPAKIIEHRQLAKLKGTYLDALPLMVNPDTGNIHCSFNQVVAATGRLSSSDPNLQNIPIRTEEGRRARKPFVPSTRGWKLLCADYSQIELRILAHFSRDPALVSAFQQGMDIHTAVAAQVYGVDPRDVQPDMRRIAKAVNFGVIYGQSPFGLAAVLSIPQTEAARFIDAYFARYAEVAKYLHGILKECKRTGFATTILGRRRRISGIVSTTGQRRNAAERTAINTVIQGSAADLIKKAMIRIHARLRDEQHAARMLLQIHDELVFEVPEAQADALASLVRTEMQTALDLTIPLVVDLRLGDNWLEAQPLSLA